MHVIFTLFNENKHICYCLDLNRRSFFLIKFVTLRSWLGISGNQNQGQKLFHLSCFGWLFSSEDGFWSNIQFRWNSILEKPSSRNGKLTSVFLDGMYMSINYIRFIRLLNGARTSLTWVLQRFKNIGNVTPLRNITNIDNSLWTHSKRMLYNRVSPFNASKSSITYHVTGKYYCQHWSNSDLNCAAVSLLSWG